MGVFKNGVGRPSNETIMMRRILRILGLSLIGIVAFYIGFHQGYKEENNKNIVKSEKKDIVSTEEAKNILKKYSISDSIYYLTESQINQNYKVLLAIENTKSSAENNICEKINKYYNVTSTKDESGNYLIEHIDGYDNVYCADKNKFYAYNDLEKQYEQLFGKNAKLPEVRVVDNLAVLEIYTYLSNPKGYVQLETELGGFVEDGETEYIYDAYISNNEMHIIFSSFFYVDSDFDGKLQVHFSEDVDVDNIDNNLSETDDGKISGDVEQFFIKNRNKIPVYEMILTKEDGNYIYKSISKVK